MLLFPSIIITSSVPDTLSAPLFVATSAPNTRIGFYSWCRVGFRKSPCLHIGINVGTLSQCREQVNLILSKLLCPLASYACSSPRLFVSDFSIYLPYLFVYSLFTLCLQPFLCLRCISFFLSKVLSPLVSIASLTSSNLLLPVVLQDLSSIFYPANSRR